MTTGRCYKLSPSELTFLYNSCKHCFVMKVRHGIYQPSIPLPGIFSTIANLQKDYFADKRTEDFLPELPPGKVEYGEKRIKSDIISFSDFPATCYIQGRFDVVLSLDDGTWLVGDFKTGRSAPEKTEMYGRQLHAYAYSLENNAGDFLSLSPVARLGLIYYTPGDCDMDENIFNLKGGLEWNEVPLDMENFQGFLKDVLTLLEGPLPNPSEDCNWCNFRALTQNVEGGSVGLPEIPKCPDCGGPMAKRNGRNGSFWGCRAYPNCFGTLDI